MAKNNENAAKILDYWFALDFLSQDKYPDYVEIRNKIKRHKEDWAKGKSKYKTIETFIRLEKRILQQGNFMMKFMKKPNLVE